MARSRGAEEGEGDLFAGERGAGEGWSGPSAPLAERMRPRRLSEYIGQEHLLAPGRLLRRAIEADRVRSLIFYGPPGTGKTTLAQVIAAHSRATFRALNAVSAGVKGIREEVEAALDRQRRFERHTLLFVDEIHRFNQAQQDALLPWVERGVVTLIGATTESPYFEVNAALNSRSHIFQLRPLSDDELRAVARLALSDAERGYGGRAVALREEALEYWLRVVGGDARALLNALELAVETTPPSPSGEVEVTLAVAEASVQARAVLYDRDGDAHFDTFSAFIKSVRGSDPDAALYWLAKMLYAGEPPRAIFRRLLIAASEDVGLAYPMGVAVVEACAAAFERVGLPEGRFHLAHATLALAAAPKSNSTMGLFDALKAVEEGASVEVPLHLKDPSRDKESLNHGAGYLYPHAYATHWVAQAHLPESLRGRVFYQPSDQGEERATGERARARREAQLEGAWAGERHPLVEAVSPHEGRLAEWVARAQGDRARGWELLRDAAMEEAALTRDALCLDLNAGAGLLTWPAVRSCVEGGVWSWCLSAREAEALRALAAPLPWEHQPRVGCGDLAALGAWRELEGVALSRIVARALTDDEGLGEGWRARLRWALERLSHNGRPRAGARLVCCEPLASAAQRLSALLPPPAGAEVLWARWREAEEELFNPARAPRLWSAARLTEEARAVSSSGAWEGAAWEVSSRGVALTRRLRLTRAELVGWWGGNDLGERGERGERGESLYAAALRAEGLSADELSALAAHALSGAGRAVEWSASWVVLALRAP